MYNLMYRPNCAIIKIRIGWIDVLYRKMQTVSYEIITVYPQAATPYLHIFKQIHILVKQKEFFFTNPKIKLQKIPFFPLFGIKWYLYYSIYFFLQICFFCGCVLILGTNWYYMIDNVFSSYVHCAFIQFFIIIIIFIFFLGQKCCASLDY